MKFELKHELKEISWMFLPADSQLLAGLVEITKAIERSHVKQHHEKSYLKVMAQRCAAGLNARIGVKKRQHRVDQMKSRKLIRQCAFSVSLRQNLIFPA